MAEMLLKAQKYMNAENTLAVIRDVEKPKEREKTGGDKKRERGDCQGTNRNKRKDDKTPRTVKFTPLIMPIDKILTQITNEYYLKWPRPLHSSPNMMTRRSTTISTRIMAINYTEDCRNLKE